IVGSRQPVLDLFTRRDARFIRPPSGKTVNVRRQQGDVGAALIGADLRRPRPHQMLLPCLARLTRGGRGDPRPEVSANEGRLYLIGAPAAGWRVRPATVRPAVSAAAVLRLLMLTLPAILTCGPMGASYMTLWTPSWPAGMMRGR